MLQGLSRLGVGLLSLQAGDLPLAKQHLEESLRMERSLHGDRDHPGIAAALHKLGVLSLQAKDLPAAKQHLEESLAHGALPAWRQRSPRHCRPYSMHWAS